MTEEGCSTGERRQSERHVTSGRFYANACRSGLIYDISRSGLSFQYIDRKRWPADSGYLDIVSDEAGFFLGGLQYRVVSDVKVKNTSEAALSIKRMTLAFENLSAEQQEKIDSILQRFSASDLEKIDRKRSAAISR